MYRLAAVSSILYYCNAVYLRDLQIVLLVWPAVARVYIDPTMVFNPGIIDVVFKYKLENCFLQMHRLR